MTPPITSPFSSAAPGPAKPAASSQVDGTLLGLLALGLYSLFTLLPGSHSMMVSWPWVFVWQAAVGMPLLWLLWQLWFKPIGHLRLGAGLDRVSALLVLVLLTSILLADFPQQARWNTVAALGSIAAVYALAGWLTTPQRALRLLQYQGVLSIGFISLSLGLWTFQIYLPELARLDQLAQLGVVREFSFQNLALRNWQPLGHQNYVAGYLLLVLPLLVGLAITQNNRWRWLWGSGVLLGIVDLYTTSSRGGILALVETGFLAALVALWCSRLSRLKVALVSGGVLATLVGSVWINDRTRNLIAAVAQGNFANGELAYRWITHVIGWRIGLDHPLVGAGPGSVPMLYQRYRPYWAGREAELHFQLRGTLAQIWAELGIGGMVALLLLIGALSKATWNWHRQPKTTGAMLPSPLTWGLLAGLVAYGMMALTDYQLDTVPISGAIALYIALLARTFASPAVPLPDAVPPTRQRYVALAGVGSILTVCLWLLPIHRAWAASSQAFQALQRDDLETFVSQLELAHTLAPWEAYYAYQLGWQLGDLSFQNPDPFRAAAIEWFEQANQASPNQEFGQANLGWLLLSRDPAAAQAAFTQAIDLVPAKVGGFLGLGQSLLRTNQTELAVEALALEALRHPLLVPSGIWQFPQFAPLYDAVMQQAITHCTNLLAETESPSVIKHIHHLRGSLHWWYGDTEAAVTDWQTADVALGLALQAFTADTSSTVDPSPLENHPAKRVMDAWQRPEDRQELLEAAWLSRLEFTDQFGANIPQQQISQLVAAMNEADSFEDWLRRTTPFTQPRNERLGFGVLNRHIDGLTPKDYLPRVENLAVDHFFAELFPSPVYFLEWDEALQPLRQQVLAGGAEP